MTNHVIRSVLLSAGVLAACSSPPPDDGNDTPPLPASQSSTSSSASPGGTSSGASASPASKSSSTPAATAAAPASSSTGSSSPGPVVANNTAANSYEAQYGQYTPPSAANLTDPTIFQFINETKQPVVAIIGGDGMKSTFDPPVPAGSYGQVGKFSDYDDGQTAEFSFVLQDGTTCAGSTDDMSFQAQGWGNAVSESNGTCSWTQSQGGGGGGGGGSSKPVAPRAATTLDPRNPTSAAGSSQYSGGSPFPF